MKQAFLLVLLCWLTNTSYAQHDKYTSYQELRGSGKLIRENRLLASFQIIDIGPFFSNVTVDVGGTQSAISIQLDDNFKPFLHVESAGDVLKLTFSDPANKPFWLGKGTIRVTIKTPSLKQLRNDSNGDVLVNNLTGNSFRLINQSNGSVTLRGTVNQFSVLSEANGDVRAEELIAQEANITTQANATVNVNARQLRSQNGGRATVRNVASSGSRPAKQPAQDSTDGGLVTVILQNNSSVSRTVTLRFTEPGKPIYGVIETRLGPYGKRRETYPVGTKIEQLDAKQQQLAMTGENAQGKLVVTLNANDNGRTYDLLD